MTKYCKNCGSELAEGSVFCDACGTKAGEASPAGGSDLFESYNIDMMDGEYVIRQSQRHIGCLYLPLLVLGFGILMGFFSFVIMLSNGYYYFGMGIPLFLNGFTIIGLIWFIVRYIGYKTNDLILTNKRVFGKCGLISTIQMQAPLNRIDSVSFKNGLIGKIIGYGTVRIATASTTFKFRFIRDGQTLYNDIFNQLEVSEVEKRDENAKAIVDAMAEKLS
jgi:membrane protein YdbS with pleckstrin-like domain